MLVPVEDHAELGAPVADVVVADRPVAEEPERAAQGVADHRGADVADVHRLGHVGGRVVDDEAPRRGDRCDAQPRIVHRRRQPLNQPRLLDSQVDEPRSGDLERMAEVGHVDRSGDLGGHLTRRPAQPLPQRHRKIRLVVAELRILTPPDHFQSFVDIVGQTGQHAAKTRFQFGEKAHGGKDEG